jgi:predicted CXXCH cytochrome family protein
LGTPSLSTSSSKRMDPLSRSCLNCHDGSAAIDAAHRSGFWGRSKKGEHPVGVLYEKGEKKRRSFLRPVASLPKSVRLAQGRIGCGTCHSPFSKEPMMLTLPIKGSRLCFSCHDL